jgi:hypothetical protein
MRPIVRGGLLAVFLVMIVTVLGDTEVVNFRTSEKDVPDASIPWCILFPVATYCPLRIYLNL